MTDRILNHRQMTLRAAAGALAVALTALAPFAPAQARPVHAAAHAPLPAEQQHDGIRYVTGGIGADKAAAFKREMNAYPLAIELREHQKGSRHDEYTADARVHIAKPGGREVFSARAEGPFMLVRLEPGTYEVSATLGDRTLHKRHVVIAKNRTVHETFVFPAGTA
jgi:hypothetical protein